MRVTFIANGAEGERSFGGNDTYTIGFAKRWGSTVITNEKAAEIYRNCKLEIWPAKVAEPFGTYVHFLYRTLYSAYKAITMRINSDAYVVGSDHLPDILPAFIIKLRNPKICFVGQYYLPAHNPICDYKGELQVPRISSILHYLQQQIGLMLLKQADIVTIMDENDTDKFKSTIKLTGDIEFEEIFEHKHSIKLYDFVYMGRLHPQKNIDSLIKEIMPRLNGRSLLVIGEGSEREKCERLARGKPIKFVGTKMDNEKCILLSSARVFLCPTLYDTNNLAAIEGMACGLPVVIFRCPQFKKHFNRGAIKVRFGDNIAFADVADKVISNLTLYSELSNEAIEEARRHDISKTASMVYAKIKQKVNEL